MLPCGTSRCALVPGCELCRVSHGHCSQVVLEVALGAAAECAGNGGERNTMLGIIYDEQLRKEVENKCGQLGATWDYTSMFLVVDESILRKARRFELG